MSNPELLNSPLQSWRDLDPSTFRVLIAEDDKALRTIVTKRLSTEGYEIDACVGGLDVMPKVREFQPDLIVLDVMMPGMSGLEILKELREDPKLASIYVILVTGRASLDAKVEGFESGADDYLTKPVQMPELRARVKAGIRVKALHRSLEQSYGHLIRKEKLATIGQLASGIAHEFNNIISGINGYAQLAQKDDRFKDKLIEAALTQSERVQKITSSLSTYASVMDADRETTDLVHLVESATWLVKKSIDSRGIELTTEAERSSVAVNICSGQIQQAFVHLLLNAIEAVDEGGKIHVSISTDDQCAHLKVDDNGPGIPEKVRHQVFDPFFTTKGALGASTGDSTGLGLSFALNIAQSHDAELQLVESSLGGAAFRISLPLPSATRSASNQRTSTASLEGPVVTAGPSDSGEHSLRLVVVEDDVFIQELVGEVFSDHDLSVFQKGREALAHLDQNPTDVALVDLNLAGQCSGRQLIEHIRSFENPPAVVVMTGEVEAGINDLLVAPVVGLLRKPFEIAELEEAVAAAADARSNPVS